MTPTAPAPTAPPATARGISPETVTRRVLDNGLVVIVYPNHTIPALNMTISFEAGAVYDPDALMGLAALTARTLRRGTRRKTFDQLNSDTEERGITVGADAGQHGVSVGGRSLAEDAGILMATIGEIVREPAFPLEEIARLRKLMIAGLKEDEDDTRSVADRTFRELIFPAGHPYHRRVSGTLETVPRIGRDEMRAFYRAHIRPDVAMLIIVGDITPDAALALAEATFGDWQAEGPRPTYTVPDPPPLTTIHRIVKPLVGKTQNDIVLGGISLRRTDPDYYALMMMNLILGQLGLYGRFGKSVREEKGLAYYAYSGVEARRGVGTWSVRAGVNPANVQRAVDAILEEVTRMRADGVTAQELADGQTYLTGVLPLRLETNGGIADVLHDIEFFGLGFDYIQRYPAIVRAITAEEVHRAAVRYLPDTAYVLSVAGPEVTLDGAA